MNNRDLLMFAQFFSQGVDKSVNAYEKAQAAEIARARNKILEQDKRDNAAYRRELLAQKRSDAADLNRYRMGSLDIKRAAAAAKASGAGAGISPQGQAYLEKYGAYDLGTGGGGTTNVTNNYNGDDNDALAIGNSSPDVDVPVLGSGGVEQGAASGGMIRSYAGGGIVGSGMSGGIDGDTPIPQPSRSTSPTAAGANMFSSSFKVRSSGGIDETGAVRQTRLQRWLDGPAKEQTIEAHVKELPSPQGAIDFTQTYAFGGMVRRPPVDAGTSGPKSGFGYRAAPPVTQGSN